ncbi:Ca-activated chloride channel family protein [Dysgonomonas sp. PFB1-18]|uniref:vWA domain-containing protein n=1 Tax=unclassified Dysgonomonas TaxID=2630389 RepID=UPI00247715C2|nr:MULTISPECIES: VWA domain-containing protein [unclassified Dysgonomonas]MDH6308586.1 Ca-activated chloride channel family protein [Dysgonomonas sp. PF1-14]MDH6338087.1 Ca-activated chloride channel family protein [Dysgonomonas sp. PF1-16]MDH6379584.1 Ca-activated chloride channel family protein [Dysgonomonas sp. PFB1-18]MDH6396914.1 Ca-activated chloride channel family protein [Dysgonomonas sp. PF1-23]
MKTYKTVILILSAIVLASCNTGSTKKTDPGQNTISENRPVTQDNQISESEIAPPPPSPNDNENIHISIATVEGTEDKEAIDIAELREHKVILAEPQRDMAYSIVQSPRYERPDNEEYSQFAENKFRMAKEEPLSTFSVDVDAASYSNMRRFINRGAIPNKDAIRIEELINYFNYDYPEPAGNSPVRLMAEVGACPWNDQNRLVKVGLKARDIPSDNLPASNFVFLIDVSGSMEGPTRLDLVKSSLKLLVNNLREKDRVAIVVYAGAAGEVLPSTSGANSQKIKEALESLSAGGSTAGGAGIQLAYKIARQNFIKNGNNRIILCTDGDFNVGVSSNDGLQTLIENERKSGVFLSILGYGMGNYKDSKMQTLAQAGNGNHAYIDNLQEANKVLVNEFGSTMYTVAKDVKLQIEFNPARVQAYRLVGYESRLLNKEDFNDDTKDAGEMGAGHTVTAFYEVIPVGVKSNLVGNVDPLKYQNENKPSGKGIFTAIAHPDLLTVKMRYKEPNSDTSKKIELPLIDDNQNNVSDDFRFAAAVAMFGQVMKNSSFKGDGTYDKAIALAQSGYGSDKQGYRREFVRLMETAKGLAKN